MSGGKFIFYVPDDYSDVPLTFTFSDLYSKYGDKTYYNDVPHMQMNGNARYSYVTSDYFKQFSGNKVSFTGFPANGGLYDTAYLTNDKGSNGPVGTETTGNFYPYTSKVFTSTAGNVRFKFNNAEDLASATGSLIEYPFSVSTYLSNYGDPDWKESSGTTQETGAFIPCKLIANINSTQNTNNYQKSDIFYVFTADETRYNIAPTTGLQHRSYAFYRMDIELEARTFTPKFTYTPIYDKTFQLHEIKDAQGNVTDTKELEDSMWGLTLDAEEETDETGEKIIGYFTYQEIIDHIQGRGNEGEDGYIAPSLDPTNTNAPKYMRQILYVDGTPLSAMLNSSENSIIKRLQDLKDSLAVNNLVFLPVNTTSTLDNTAYKTLSGTFRAGKDIVLTDKQPFYSPYDIQIDAANKATYTRMISATENGKVENATIMLPFTMALKDGVHTNPDNATACSFSVNVMNPGETNNPINMELEPGSTVDHGVAFFKKLDTETTEANKPYMIHVETPAGESDDFSFVAAQKGAKIIATPSNGVNSTIGTGMLHTYTWKESETGPDKSVVAAKFGDYSYTFENKGTFSGAKFDREKSENVFYFAHNMYLDLRTLEKYKDGIQDDAHLNQYLYIYPFRGVYTYTRTGGPSGAKPMHSFEISFDEYVKNFGIATDLDRTGTTPDLMIRSGRGMLTITASHSQDVVIRSINGMVVKNANVEAGNTTTVALPAGIYIVNNTKIIVK